MEQQCEVIAEYENELNMKESERFTEYISEYSCFMFKLGIDKTDKESIEKRYQQALDLKRKYAEQNPDISIMFTVKMKHNLLDTATFNMKNQSIVLEKFFYSDLPERKLGIRFQDSEEITYLLRQFENEGSPEILPFTAKQYETYSVKKISQMEQFKFEWFKILQLKENLIKAETKKLLDLSESRISCKQEKISYKKEIRKKMKMNNKVFIDSRMEGYDFREVVLTNAIFINCCLARANFAYVMMENAVFINCDLTDAIFIGAELNNAFTYTKCEVKKIIDGCKWILEN